MRGLVVAARDGCLMTSQGKGGVEHAGHNEWVANTMTQAYGWTMSGLPDPLKGNRAEERVAEVVRLTSLRQHTVCLSGHSRLCASKEYYVKQPKKMS